MKVESLPAAVSPVNVSTEPRACSRGPLSFRLAGRASTLQLFSQALPVSLASSSLSPTVLSFATLIKLLQRWLGPDLPSPGQWRLVSRQPDPGRSDLSTGQGSEKSEAGNGCEPSARLCQSQAGEYTQARGELPRPQASSQNRRLRSNAAWPSGGRCPW